MKRCQFCGTVNDDSAVQCKSCNQFFDGKKRVTKKHNTTLEIYAGLVIILGIVYLFLERFKVFVNIMGIVIIMIGLIELTLHSKILQQKDQIDELKKEIKQLKEKIEE